MFCGTACSAIFAFPNRCVALTLPYLLQAYPTFTPRSKLSVGLPVLWLWALENIFAKKRGTAANATSAASTAFLAEKILEFSAVPILLLLVAFFKAGLLVGSMAFQDDLKKRVAILSPAVRSPDGNFYCEKCGCCMEVPGFIVADAGQAYEVLSLKIISSTFLVLFSKLLSSTKTRSMYVMHARVFQAGWGGDIGLPYQDRTIMRVKSLWRLVVGYMGMRFFHVW